MQLPFSRDAVHRPRRLHGGPAARIPPPVAGRGGAAAVRVRDPLRRGGEGRAAARWWSCAAATIRRRAAATRPDGRTVKGHHPVGLGRARGPLRGPAVRPALHGAGPGRGRGGLQDATSTRSRWWWCRSALIEPSVRDDAAGHATTSSSGWATSSRDPVDHTRERLVFNRTVTLRDTWAKSPAEGAGRAAPQGTRWVSRRKIDGGSRPPRARRGAAGCPEAGCRDGPARRPPARRARPACRGGRDPDAGGADRRPLRGDRGARLPAPRGFHRHRERPASPS